MTSPVNCKTAQKFYNTGLLLAITYQLKIAYIELGNAKFTYGTYNPGDFQLSIVSTCY